jgi:hypothetical protein
MPSCLAYQELLDGLTLIAGNFPPEGGREPPVDRLEWMLRRHNSDGSDGCDWCVLAEEIRRLRGLKR